MNAEEIKQKLEEFDKRWNIINDLDYQTEFEKFRLRIINLLNTNRLLITSEYLKKFCQIWALEYNEDLYLSTIFQNTVINSSKTENNEKHFYKLIQSLFYLPDEGWYNRYSNEMKYITDLFDIIQDIVNYSNINLSVSINNFNVILYPKGEKELDEKLVNQVLSFLNPDSNTLFKEGLTSYLEVTDRSFIDAVDKMRRTLEEFLRFKLSNKKGFKENIKELNTIHKADKKDKQIRNIIINVFNYLDEYFNENTKHKDGDIDDNECEYIIYQTGVLLRYINNIKFIK
ncbi:MAG: hypothetical protein WC139_12135 [Candidatus Kapaibacterium sp.]